MTTARIEPQPESYESTLITRNLHLYEQSCYLVVHQLGIKP